MEKIKEDLLLRRHPTRRIAHNRQVERALAGPPTKFLNGICQVRINLPINLKSFFHHQPGRGSVVVVNSGIGRSKGGEDGFVERKVITQAVPEVPTRKGDVMLDEVMSISKQFL
jgi:hypothetical protein